MSKKIISVLLAVVMVLAMGTVALVSVSADLASLPEVADGCNRYFFYMPDQWYNDYAYTAGIYWWEGTDACSAWPGYEANEADVDGVYYYDVPQDVTTIIWNNFVDGGTDKTLDIYKAAVQTKNIGSEYYDIGESDNYPDGTESFDGMIYVTDMLLTEENPYSGKLTYAGEWCYYYGDGKYGFTEVEGEGDVFTDPAFNWDPDASIATEEASSEDEITEAPTEEPTVAPTEEPTDAPTVAPEEPTEVPSEAPTETPATTVITVDGVEYPAQVGDVLTYTVDVTAARLFENIQASVTYDASMLELQLITSDDPDVADWEVQGPEYCQNLDGVIFNAGIEGLVKFNASKVAGYNFKEGANLITLTFVVKEDAASEIAISIEEMTIKGGSESYFTGGEASVTEGITVVEALAGNTVPVEPPTEEPTTVPAEEPTTVPVTDAPATDAPATDAPATDAPATDAPATDAPAEDPTSATDAPEDTDTVAPVTGAAAYIYVVVAVLAMAACAVVVLRKRVNG